MDGSPGVTLLLGPTNTGKTHRAVERMLSHESGMIGLPLRLLAREVYDRITAKIGELEVALVTGEEQRVPRRPRYWVCTVEAMPIGREVDFVAVDEIQLVSHPERGHVFTDRLLHARGRIETWFMGSDAARELSARLVPAARVRAHPRLSRLRSFGTSTLSALPPRSAIVAFSAARVYEIAEKVRERKGGAAVVLGALSPRARNAQVALYQAGEVDYLVATDAIGMGLNLDVFHVAFADVAKFDGKESRPLELAELAQIAGRAGRYLNDGTFGTLAPLARVEALTGDAARGRAAWARACALCHGDGSGNAVGPSLRGGNAPDRFRVIDYVRNGPTRTDRESMDAWMPFFTPDALPDQDLADLAALIDGGEWGEASPPK